MLDDGGGSVRCGRHRFQEAAVVVATFEAFDSGCPRANKITLAVVVATALNEARQLQDWRLCEWMVAQLTAESAVFPAVMVCLYMLPWDAMPG